MSLPLGPVAAIGAARLAARAVETSVDASVQVARGFAQVFADTTPESDSESDAASNPIAPSTPSGETDAVSLASVDPHAARDSLSEFLLGLMRQLGFSGDEPMVLAIAPSGESVQVQLEGTATESTQHAAAELQARINTDESLRGPVITALRRLPDEQWSPATGQRRN